MNTKDFLKEKFGISEQVFDFCNEAEAAISHQFAAVDDVADHNQAKVLWAMQKSGLTDAHFHGTTGYGFNDIGRDAMEQIYADAFGADVAMVRMQITSGTHALSCALFGNLRHGDKLIYATGQPYDSLHRVIGITPTKGSLAEHGVEYQQIDQLPDGRIDFKALETAICSKTKIVALQRSRGYAFHRSYDVAEIKEAIDFIKSIRKDVFVMIDNCYGEFVERIEPTDVGADAIVGSLIKNPGGGIAPTGGYVAGCEEFVVNSANRLFAPSLTLEAGSTLGTTPSILKGFFLAPSVVASSLKTAIFMAEVFGRLGFKTSPGSTEKRTDIPQAIRLGSTEKMLAFCKGIQKAAPVDSYFQPEPDHMPGYSDQVVFASGSFTQGSTIELSADGPIRPPYDVYAQGGLTWHHGKIGVMVALNEMVVDGLVKL